MTNNMEVLTGVCQYGCAAPFVEFIGITVIVAAVFGALILLIVGIIKVALSVRKTGQNEEDIYTLEKRLISLEDSFKPKKAKSKGVRRKW